MSEPSACLPVGEAHKYLLVSSGGRWAVRIGQDKHGPYLSRRDAFLDAVDAAHAAAELGATAEVVDGTAVGAERVLWRSDRDAYPPVRIPTPTHK